ncbi:serine aminopeptidase domain-containing protein [Arsenicicoccus sp. oral taxon 190]|uniref:serine aminopeptidase domain-containing protein n=1 Tax=Arsenicicoccus sp. oral taxon 190 TaxID=1658671 RepID=UPI00155DA9B4|nr:alpha/beta hydrolase [Arsenicicoccus sp. oral taxon 190]
MDTMSTVGEPTWIGRPGRALAGWVEMPSSRRARGVVILAPTMGREGVSSYRSLRALAVRLAERGFASVRFDWRGDGNSASAEGADVVAGWVEDLDVVHDEVLRIAGELPVHLVALRLGASIAHRWGRPVSGRTILWEPISGRAYLRLHQKLRVLGTDIPVMPQESGTELSGSFFTPAQVQHLKGLAAPKPAARLQDRASLRVEEDRDTAEHLYFAAPRYARIPYAAIDAIIDDLEEASPTASPLAAWHGVSTTAFTVDDAAVTETFVRVGPHALHAIETRPTGEVLQACAFTSAGGEPLDGPTGLWTQAARRAAARGALCLRSERRGLGVHLDPAVPVEPNPYTLAAVEDAAASIQHLRSRTDRPVVAVGLCVGAWLFLRACATAAPDRILAFDNIVWQPDPRFVERYFKEPLLRRFLTESPGVGDDADEGIRAPGARTRIKEALKRGREVSRRRPLPVRRVLARRGLAEYPYELLSLAPRTTRIDLQFGAAAARHFDDVHGQESLARLRAEGRPIDVAQWDDLDHALLAETARRRSLESVVRAVTGP